ncbi:MAG: fumarylacetoacetate hydrolase family protein [Coxiellaceae bacterium]|nr:fumarylacetoacetate hydrolase family protein [Coxiellaceae bacterium]
MTENIICFGKNYRGHMHELGDKAVDKPVIFLKPAAVLHACKNWNDTLNLYLPEEEIHYECELVFKLNVGGFQLSQEKAREALGWYTVGLDMTKRNLQKKLKEDGHPWTIGKVFPDAAVIGPWIKCDNLDSCLEKEFNFSLNNQLKQTGLGKNMLFSPIDLIVYVSHYFPLSAGDILFTGTPSGVGKITNNDIGTVKIGSQTYFVTWAA